MTYLSDYKKILYGLVAFAVLCVAYFAGLNTLVARAATLVFSPADCYTAAATSTLSYMTKGTATTTVACAMGGDGANTAVVSIILNASSTVSNLVLYTEESMDGQDWFPIAVNQSASTTNPFTLTTRAYAQLTFASSTIGATAEGVSLNRLGVNGTNNRNHYELEVPVNMKRVRVHAAVASTSPDLRSENGAVWMQIIPKTGI